MTAMHPGDRTYRNQTIRIADLTVIADHIEGVTFENCIIDGPAVVVLIGGTSIRGCQFEGDTASLFWEIEESREQVVGAVALEGCTIVGCQFRRVGIAAGGAQLEQLRRGFGG